MMNTGPALKFAHQLLCSTSAWCVGDWRKSVSSIELLGVLWNERYSASAAQRAPTTHIWEHLRRHTWVTCTHALLTPNKPSGGEGRLTYGRWRESYAHLWTRWSVAWGNCVSVVHGRELPHPGTQFETFHPPQNHPYLADIQKRM